MIDPVIELSIGLGLALLFAAAAWHKMADQVRFGAALRAYRLLPSWLVSPVAWFVSVAEAVIAVSLLYPPTRQAATLVAAALLMLYTGAIVANLARGRRDIDCGCFASSARVPLSGWLVVRNAILILVACVLFMPVRARSLLWIDVLTIVTALVALTVLWAAGQRLAHTGPALRRFGGTP
jgi:hypothetical protein